MIKKTFEKCLWEDLNFWFDLERLEENFEPLQHLLRTDSIIINEEEQKQLQILHHLVSKRFTDWNEDELKMQFISPLLHQVDYHNSHKFQPFSQRMMRMETEKIEISGIVEWVLASGKQIPREPYFFLHEYKKEQGTEADPLGQLLAAMLTAQYLNQDKNKILYGTYITGKDWYFVALAGKQYQRTLPYSVTELDKLLKVYAILQNIKLII